ncbi:LysE family translocator [Dendrosporobacter sp. 1207_IL3150]|uniref:LysE family translocator n=1 Tax=Dendrosporobacter sp. 1207_IL3150 TaxID=3084054 RepID=UPI002FD970EA
MNLPISGTELYSFMLVMMLMIVTPGVNQVLVLQSGLNFGHKAAIYNVAGITSSMFVHTLLSGLGISIIIIKSPSLLGLFKVVGSGYLIYLAISSIFNAYQLRNTTVNSTDLTNLSDSEISRKSFTRGFTTNVLNIQTSFIFLSIFPQYMNLNQSLLNQSLFLTLIFILLLIAWYAVIISLIFKIRHYLLDINIQRKLKTVSGVLLLVMAINMLVK